MNYRELFNEAKRLANPWPEQTGFSPHPSDVFDREKAKQLPTLKGFIPTGFDKLDALVNRLGVAIVYDVRGSTEDANEVYPNFTPMEDKIHLPHPDAFVSRLDYARTLAHEMSHWTLMLGRSQRDGLLPTEPGDLPYLFNGAWEPVMVLAEELTAELSQIAVSLRVLPTEAQAASMDYSLHYLRGWLDNAKRLHLPKSIMDRVQSYATEQAERSSAFLLSHLETP